MIFPFSSQDREPGPRQIPFRYHAANLATNRSKGEDANPMQAFAGAYLVAMEDQMLLAAFKKQQGAARGR